MSERAIELHASPWQGAFFVTGGGASFLAELLNTSGASGTVLEATVPYAYAALTELLGHPPDQATSELTARQLAMAAYERAQYLGQRNLFGFGLTAALATNRIKKGKHRAHWAIQTATDTYAFSAEYSGDRVEEEACLLEQIWQSVQHCLLKKERPQQHQVTMTNAHGDAHLVPLFDEAPYRYATEGTPARLLLPGSFNPLHDGHKQMLAIAEAQTGLPGAYELSVRNADKHNLDYITLQARLDGISNEPLWLTNTPTYAEKAKLFEQATFALGVDTLSRIAELRFYQHRADLLQQALETFAEQQIQFLVFGREDNGRFMTLKDLELPELLAERCEGVDESTFRNDISSTSIRLRL